MVDDQRWRKSSHSSTNGDCVEVNGTIEAIRDSKQLEGSVLSVAGLIEFLSDVKSGRFDR